MYQGWCPGPESRHDERVCKDTVGATALACFGSLALRASPWVKGVKTPG
jgi:hypothetical protein